MRIKWVLLYVLLLSSPNLVNPRPLKTLSKMPFVFFRQSNGNQTHICLIHKRLCCEPFLTTTIQCKGVVLPTPKCFVELIYRNTSFFSFFYQEKFYQILTHNHKCSVLTLNTSSHRKTKDHKLIQGSLFSPCVLPSTSWLRPCFLPSHCCRVCSICHQFTEFLRCHRVSHCRNGVDFWLYFPPKLFFFATLSRET